MSMCSELMQRREAIKLLRKVDLIAAEVAVRLMHLETQVSDLVAYEAKKEAGRAEDEEEDVAANSSLNSCTLLESPSRASLAGGNVLRVSDVVIVVCNSFG